MTELFANTIGVDVSKSNLDAFCHENNTYKKFDNSESGISKLLAWVKKLPGSSLVIIEPTGGYEIALQNKILATDSINIAKVNARQIRDFARAKGRIAKTDSIDASILAEYGKLIKPRNLALTSENKRELAALVSRRQQLTRAIVKEKTKLDRIVSKLVVKNINEVIEFLDEQLKTINKAIKNTIKNDQDMREANKILQSVAGVGDATASLLLAELPELGRIDNKAISSLVGVAPHNVDSGNMRGQRCIQGGRKSVRNVLYMATLTAIKWHDKISQFYRNLIARGKKPKVAITASMRKLVIILNAKMREYYASKNQLTCTAS